MSSAQGISARPVGSTSVVLAAAAGVAGMLALVLAPSGVQAREPKSFTFSAKANARLARQLSIPPYFALPSSARGAVPSRIDTTDTLVDFKHPDAMDKDLGLRVVMTRRKGMTKRLVQSGLVKTGDLLLTFRPEWGGSGAYPNIQMGVSHVGIAYVKDGELRNIDNPLDQVHHGKQMRGDLTGEHYGTLKFMHLIRPRDLDDGQRATLLAWIERLKANASQIYPSRLAFNDDYQAPKFDERKRPEFVRQVGLIALGQSGNGPALALYCSEFAWSLLSLRKCDPATTAAQFSGRGMPSCISEPMRPMSAIGEIVHARSRGAYSGLADGPLLVIDSMRLGDAQRLAMIKSLFKEDAIRQQKMSKGHLKLAKEFQPRFAPLEQYYVVASGDAGQRPSAGQFRAPFNSEIKPNYSPTSYLINTLLPPDNPNRTMDYIATIVVQ